MATITVPAHVNHLDAVLAFISDTMHNVQLDAGQRNSIIISSEEVFVNISNYAYTDGEGDVTINISVVPEKVTIMFKDSGIPYNPLLREDPDISLTAEEREIGGLGILMIKKMMDDVCYEYNDGYNILTILKSLKSEVQA